MKTWLRALSEGSPPRSDETETAVHTVRDTAMAYASRTRTRTGGSLKRPAARLTLPLSRGLVPQV